jgi:hypothetical protein
MAKLDELAPKPNLGSGISRPTGKRPTREYRLRVCCPRQQPLLVKMQAENKRSALKYAANRWPGAVVEVVQ